MRARLQAWADQDVVDADRLAIAFEPGTLDYYRGHLIELERRLGRRGRLLDVGCATGALLQVARELGWEVQGLEAGHASADYARKQLGLTVHNEPIEEFAPADGPFDAIVCLEVIEHVASPTVALARFERWLVPDGLLLLSTPNFDSLYRRLHGAGWWVINCEDEHVMFFSPRTLARMLEKCGFEVVRMRVRSIDIAGLLGKFRARPASAGTGAASAADTAADGALTQGYYDSRARKQRIKAWLERSGLIRLARLGLAALDAAFSARFSPLHAMGDQLICIARRRDRG